MNSEPDLVTGPYLKGALDELRRCEPIFHHPKVGTTRADYQHMTAEEFWEIGASGQRYSRDYVFDVLESHRADPPDKSDWESSDFHCRGLAPDVYLPTYTLRQGERLTRRSSIGGARTAIERSCSPRVRWLRRQDDTQAERRAVATLDDVPRRQLVPGRPASTAHAQQGSMSQAM